VATILNNLAALYYDQGRYAEAEPLYNRTLKILEKTLGENHPYFAIALNNYAVLLRKLNRDAEAKEVESRAEAIQVRIAQRNLPA
jgi:tetratricopeptide (TPR) repeat protein